MVNVGKFFSFFLKEEPSPEPKETETQAASLEPSAKPFRGSAETLVSQQELQKGSFLFTDQLIFEFVDPTINDKPALLDDFHYLSHKLKDNPHPAVLKLLDFGMKDGKPYRAWERRFFHNILSHNQHTDEQVLKSSSLQFLDALQHLSSLGLHVWRLYLPQFFSADQNGVFVARFPWTAKTRLLVPDFEQYRPSWWNICRHWFLEPEHLIETGTDFSKADQFQMGAFIWTMQASAMPYSIHPTYATTWNHPIERVDYDFPSPLRDVLYRLTELKPENRYPSFDEGFKKLRSALELIEPNKPSPLAK